LEWVKRLQALAQTGLAYSHDAYDRERFAAAQQIAAEIAAAGSDTPIEKIRELFQSETGYATPKVDVRGVVFRDDRILLVKDVSDGCWTLPGGWADVLESPREAVEREVREESGFVVRATKLTAVYDRANHAHEPSFPFHVYKLFMWCEVIGGAATPSAETSEVAFFAEGELPPLSRSRITPEQIARAFAHLREPDLPTEFD